ncbi:hypothetical protein [Fluviispira vulneris]|uniref:hypothetical protein n=1 Tax=Fluviispira vulneris TaxID=2763012 RepID=UPI00164847FE|nr:hypothetical protein [Fluviispira vulneris]
MKKFLLPNFILLSLAILSFFKSTHAFADSVIYPNDNSRIIFPAEKENISLSVNPYDIRTKLMPGQFVAFNGNYFFKIRVAENNTIKIDLPQSLDCLIYEICSFSSLASFTTKAKIQNIEGYYAFFKLVHEKRNLRPLSDENKKQVKNFKFELKASYNTPSELILKSPDRTTQILEIRTIAEAKNFAKHSEQITQGNYYARKTENYSYQVTVSEENKISVSLPQTICLFDPICNKLGIEKYAGSAVAYKIHQYKKAFELKDIKSNQVILNNKGQSVLENIKIVITTNYNIPETLYIKRENQRNWEKHTLLRDSQKHLLIKN